MFIGNRPVKEYEALSEDFPLVKVVYENNEVEYFSKVMFDKIYLETPCDDSALRDKRVFAIVEELLKILRNWGIKLNELAYMSAVLNESLMTNHKEALKELWGQWMPKPDDPNDVSLITVDRILKEKKVTLDDVINKS